MGRRRIAMCLAAFGCAVALAPAGTARAQTVTNVASGSSGGTPLIADRATVTLERAASVVTSVVAEVDPIMLAAASAGVELTFDVMPTIQAGDAGISRIELDLPAGFANAQTRSVYIDGIAQSRATGAPAANEFSETMSGSTLEVFLGSKVETTLTSLRIVIGADTPDSAGVVSFDLRVADGSLTAAASAGDADGDPTDGNTLDVELVRTQGLVLSLDKRALREEASIGEVVTYVIDLENTSGAEVTDVLVRDRIPPGFDYLEESARLGGAAMTDPSGHETLVFGVGTLPAPVDVDGNGSIDPGEPGHARIAYQLVVGSGAGIGTHENRAVAVDVCESCTVSNESFARVRVVPAPEIDLGTILGKVFRDEDRDGWQDDGEPGVPGAMIVLDDGSYVLTDAHGRYHFPAVRPGRRMLKLNASSLGGSVEMTTDESRILHVTPGLLARASFGVIQSVERVRIGQAHATGVRLETQTHELPRELVGSAWTLSALLNGAELRIPTCGARLFAGDREDVVLLTGRALAEPLRFEIEHAMPELAARWRLFVRDAAGTPVRVFSGEGDPPATIVWDGKAIGDSLVVTNEIYQYQLEVEGTDGSLARGPGRLFGVNRNSLISLNLTGEAFEVNEAILNEEGKSILRRIGSVLERYPDERISVEGHTDASGSREHNLDLSRRRAESALSFLVAEAELDPSRFELSWYGEDRPLATNELPEGRALNRRIEVKGTLEDVEITTILDRYRIRPFAALNGDTLALTGEGRFTASWTSGAAVEITMGDAEGRVGRVVAEIPTVEILGPTEEIRLGDPTFGDRALLTAPEGWSWRGPNETVTGLLAGRTEPGNKVSVDGQAAEVAPDGTFSVPIALSRGINPFGVVAESPDGYPRIMNLEITVLTQEPDGRPVVVAEGVPSLEVHLPSEGAVLSSPSLVVSGWTAHRNEVLVNGTSTAVDTDGRFVAEVTLPSGRSVLAVDVRDPEGAAGRIERPVEVSGDGIFLLAFADGQLGRLVASGRYEPTGLDEERTYYTDGRVAFYLKGRVLGSYLLTAALDTEHQDEDSPFRSMDPDASQRLLTNLDPDKLYPVYGDGSTIVYDTESDGPLYLALEGPELDVLFGSYDISFDGTELAAYHRALDGGRAVYASAATTRYGAHDTEVVVFGADVEHAHVRDEVRATGGSLYYLSQRDVVEGSELVELVVRDKHTGLVLSRRPQRRNTDYTIKHREGRILFERPISSVSAEGGSLVDPGMLSGHPVHIHVDYEHRSVGFDEAGFGGRARRQLGDHVAIGATHVDDDASDGYRLSGGDVELRFGASGRVVAEYADAEGLDARVLVSEDGGITYAEAPASVEDRGEAWKAAFEIEATEWVNLPGSLWVRAHVRRLDEGFRSAGTRVESGTEHAGGSLDWSPGVGLTLSGRFDRERRLDASADGELAESRTGSVQTELDRGRWGVSAELFERKTEDVRARALDLSRVAAARLFAELVPRRLRVSAESQVTLEGVSNDRSTLGVDVRVFPWLGIDVEGSTGAGGEAIEGGAVLTRGESRIYVGQRLESDPDAHSTTFVGSDAVVGRIGRVYSEHRWVKSRDNDRAVRLVGLERQWDLWPGFRLLLSAESARTRGAGEPLRRTTLAGGASFAADDVRATTRTEVRREQGAVDRSQLVTSNRLSLEVLEGFSVFGKLRYARTRDRRTDELEARILEESLGLAYRPIRHDRVNALGRYTRREELLPPGLDGSTARGARILDVASVEAVVPIGRYVEGVGKVAARFVEEPGTGAAFVRTETVLWLTRLNVTTWRRLELGLELRSLAQREADDSRTGWLGEVMWRLARRFRLGGGYNFTDFSDNEFAMDDYSVGGWFVRAQGLY